MPTIRRIAACLALAVAVAPPPAFAQQPATCARVGSKVTITAAGHDTTCVLKSGAVSYTVTVAVAAPASSTPPAPAPTPSAPSQPPVSSATPWAAEDFSGYASTADLIADPKGVYQKVEDINAGRITLDASVGYGSSGKSMRYDYPDRSGVGGSGTSGRCTDYTISRSLKLPSDVQEVWVDVIAKTSVDFSTQAPSSWGCTSDQGLKFLDGNVDPGDRFSIGLRTGLSAPSTGQLWFGYPDNVTDPAGMVDFVASANATDGNWHQYRCYWKISSGYPNAPKADGRIACWVDGRKVVDEPNILTTSTAGNRPPVGFYGLALGRNVNQGPDHPQSIWWGRVAIYRTNPGW